MTAQEMNSWHQHKGSTRGTSIIRVHVLWQHKGSTRGTSIPTATSISDRIIPCCVSYNSSHMNPHETSSSHKSDSRRSSLRWSIRPLFCILSDLWARRPSIEAVASRSYGWAARGAQRSHQTQVAPGRAAAHWAPLGGLKSDGVDRTPDGWF